MLLRSLTFFLTISITLLLQGQSKLDVTTTRVSNTDLLTYPDEYAELWDYDADGDDDLVVGGNLRTEGLKIFINNNGEFNETTELTFTENYKDFILADFDGDGDKDLCIGFNGFPIDNNSLIVWENLGGGNFGDPVGLPYTQGYWSMVSGDFTGDGLPDIVIADLTGGNQPRTIYMVENNGDFTFEAATLLLDPMSALTAIEVLDMDNDDDNDIYVEYNQKQVLFINDGTNSFTELEINNSGTTGTLSNTLLADFNGDNFIDFAYITDYDDDIFLLENNGDNTFSSSQSITFYTADDNPINLAAFDYDSDQDQDLIVLKRFASSNAGAGAIFINDGSGSMTLSDTTITNLTSGGATLKLAKEVLASDVDDDGDIDLITYTKRDGDIILHRQQSDGTYSSDEYLNYYSSAITRLQVLDFDSDGNMDVIQTEARNSAGKTYLFYGDGTGGFTDQKVIFDNISNSGQDVLLGQWNDNSSLDLFYAHSARVILITDAYNDAITSDTLILFSSNGTNNPVGNIGLVNSESNALELIDIDNDGDLDLFIADQQSIGTLDYFAWIENDGTNQGIMHQQNVTANSYRLGDIDGDEMIDVIFSAPPSATGSGVSYYTMTFDETTDLFTNKTEYVVTNGNIKFTIGDLDGDNDLDIVYNGLRWLENTSGTFSTDAELVSNIGVQDEIICSDLNNDGFDDIIFNDFATTADLGINALLNNGDLTFDATDLNAQSTVENLTGTTTRIITGDIDADGDLDILSTATYAGYETVLFQLCANSFSTVQTESCGDYTAPSGAVFTTSGIYEDIITNNAGCDSTITIDLTIHPVYNETASAEICEGDTYDLGTQSLTASGEFTEVFTSINGCDSTVVLTLTVNPVYNETATAAICVGDSYEFGTQTLTASGEFTETFESVSGCDSTVVLTLTVNEVYNETAMVGICDGDTYTFGNQSLTSAGEYTEVLTASTGCDSTVVLTLQVNPTYNETASANICSGDSYSFGSQTLTAAGEYTEVFASTTGCDSTVVLSLQVDPIHNETASTSICSGDTYTFGSQTLSEAGEYTEVFESITGCDSTVVLTLSINEVYNETAAATICEGETYSFGSQQLSMTGEYSETFTSTTGCDSTVNLNLIVNPSFNEEISETICSGDFFSFDGSDLTEEGTYTATYQSTSGCDSLVTLDLVVNNLDNGVSIENNTIISHQDGASYQWYDCDSNEPIDGANTQSFSPLSSGDYFVEISSGVCTAVSECVTINATILSSKRSIDLFPNPAQDYLQISDKSLQSLKYQIIDLSGREAQSGSIPDSGIIELKIQKGTFLLLIDTEDKQIKHKFFKN